MLYFNYTSGDRASAVVYIYSQDRFKSSVSTYRKHGVGGPRALARAPRDRQRATTMCTAGGTRGNHSTAPVTPKRRRAAVAPSATAASESPERAVATRAAIARACAAHADSPATRRRWDMPSHARMTPLQPPKSVPLRVAESPEVPPMQEKAGRCACHRARAPNRMAEVSRGANGVNAAYHTPTFTGSKCRKPVVTRWLRTSWRVPPGKCRRLRAYRGPR